MAPHPLDPLSAAEIEAAVVILTKLYGPLRYNAVCLLEPKKADMTNWLAGGPRPRREAEVVVVGNGDLTEGIVDLDGGVVREWERREGVQPMLTVEDLQGTEHIIRKDPRVIEQCAILGIPVEDMHKVYCDPWTIGYDPRFGSTPRLQQAFLYYRPTPDTNQYAHPLDFTPIVNTATGDVVTLDIPSVRRPLNHIPSNYVLDPAEYRKDVRPIDITQPEGVSFTVRGREVEWQKWRLHVGFSHKEGIVLNNIRYMDGETERPLFWRLSLAEMVVPYGNPEWPHIRKHAFDLGEYGGGYMTNNLSLGCDCKGSIHYLPASFPTSTGTPHIIPRAICLHEEDTGLLFKHTDFRDSSVIVTRGRKLIISQIFTAANYEYCIYWSLHQDGTIQLEIKLTGILNTYAMSPTEDTHGWGTQVHPGVNAHNHQHLFCLRIDPNVDGAQNTVFQVDAVKGDGDVGSEENRYGNAFTAKRTKYSTVAESFSDYDAATSRTWDICNTNKVHPYSGKHPAYKLVSREAPPLLIKEGGLVWKRAGFARHAIHVTPYADTQLHPAGRHVPQTSGDPPQGLPEWCGDGTAPIDNTDIVLWHTFGLTHFPAPEDFPVMPAEGMSLLLRPRNFFARNPALDVPPSYVCTPSGAVGGTRDGTSVEVGGGVKKKEGCCK